MTQMNGRRTFLTSGLKLVGLVVPVVAVLASKPKTAEAAPVAPRYRRNHRRRRWWW